MPLTSLEWSWPVNQPSHYMTNIVRPGFTRCVFSANYCVTSDLANNVDSAQSHPIVLCIDRQVVEQKAQANRAQSKSAPMRDPVTDTFQAAIALAEQDPLLECVSSWLQQDLDWRPMPIDTGVSVDLTLSSTASEAHRIGLAFGQYAHGLPVFPVALGDVVKIQEHKQSVRVCLAQIPLSVEDSLRVKPGSCMVLPDTFKAGCTVDLCDGQSGTSLGQVYLDRHQNQLSRIGKVLADGHSNTSSPPIADENPAVVANVTRIVLQQPITLNMSEWFCHNDELAITAKLAPLAGQRVLVQIQRADSVEEFNAQLIEVGTGLAAVLESSE